MTTTPDLHAIAAELQRCSDVFTSVTVEYPGFIVAVTESGPLWAIGTANGPLTADYYETEVALIDGHSPNKSIQIATPLTSSPRDVAAAIFTAMCEDDNV